MPGDGVCGASARRQQIHRNGGGHSDRAAGEEENAVAFRDFGQFAQQRFGAMIDLHKVRPAVRDFHHRGARALKGEEFIARPAHHRVGNAGGAGVKVEGAGGHSVIIRQAGFSAIMARPYFFKEP